MCNGEGVFFGLATDKSRFDKGDNTFRAYLNPSRHFL